MSSFRVRRTAVGRKVIRRGVAPRLAPLLGVVLVVACAPASRMEGRISGLRQVIEEAEANGARDCAPRELALARAHLGFAEDLLERGFPQRAEDEFVLAEPNARAAFTLSPPTRCLVQSEEPEPAPEPQPGDRDGDGILDPSDSCPDQPEDFDAWEDEDGCPDDQDVDGDGIPDTRDLCVLEPEDLDGRGDADGCPDPDDDLDGVADGSDRCPTDPEDRDGYLDEDGCPDGDDDQDGVLDGDDDCPDEPGTAAERGCPRVYQAVQVTRTHVRITQQVHFATNRAVILPDSFTLLNTVAQVLRDYPEISLEVQGHTDDRGSDRHNMRLSQQRADAVRDYLLRQGIAQERLVSRGYGETQPMESNRTPEGRAANRRVEFVRTDEAARRYREEQGAAIP
ncbi:MAG: OmpA family protein [Sandaracinus sp.]|nr:OmpA family protein [Sandaracinus sp.]MCB9612173.1 OmpA family protein [Sandaracinus sp.]MCB9637038.1 OmpA family protein [Sandaracinus sp.]